MNKMAAACIALSITAGAATVSAAAPGASAAPARPATFAACAMCHKTENGAPNGLGPNLFGIGGKKAGVVPGFNFSPAMKQSKGVWDKQKLTAFIIAPRSVVPGTTMSYAGMKDPAAAARIADYILALK